MENWILVVGYDRPYFEATRKDWLKDSVHLGCRYIKHVARKYSQKVSHLVLSFIKKIH
jgi:hypothetical protein